MSSRSSRLQKKLVNLENHSSEIQTLETTIQGSSGEVGKSLGEAQCQRFLALVLKAFEMEVLIKSGLDL